VSLASGTGSCGNQGIGLWTSLDGVTWSVGACAHTGTNDDRESIWVDNNPTSPFYGRMYISWNDFNVGGRALYVTHSDDGVQWFPVQVKSSFIRDMQITGASDGNVFLAAMDEGGRGVCQPREPHVSVDRWRPWVSTLNACGVTNGCEFS
jgi:hypothetical protein